MLRAFSMILVLLVLAALPLYAQNMPATTSSGSSTDTSSSMSTTGTTPSMSSTATTGPTLVSQTDMLVGNIVANYYGLDPANVSKMLSNGYTPGEVAVAANIAATSGRPFSEIVGYHDSNMSWTQIAQRVNIPESSIWAQPVGSMVAMGPTTGDMDSFQRSQLRATYGLSDRQIRDLRARGFSYNEISMIANAAARTGRPVNEIADLRAAGTSWSAIASRYNVSLADLTTPAFGRMTMAPRGAGVARGSVYGYGYESLRDAYNRPLTSDEFDRLRRLGWNDQEMRVAAMVRARSNDSLDDLARLRMAGLSWYQIADRSGISYRDIERARTEEFWLP